MPSPGNKNVFFVVNPKAPVVEVLTLKTGCRIVDHTPSPIRECSPRMRKLSSAPAISIAALPALPAVASLLCSCQGVMLWGNLVVLAVSVGLFLGTLALGRS